MHGKPRRPIDSACQSSRPAACRAIPAQMSRAKTAILAQSRLSVAVPEHLIRLAVNEAEALAWQTRYPHLLFPTLAAEKIEAVAAWNARQNQIRHLEAVSAFAE
jgi:hypothetical protein